MKKSKKQEIAERYLSLIPETYVKTPQEMGYSECPCIKKCSIEGQCRLYAAYHARKKILQRCERFFNCDRSTSCFATWLHSCAYCR